MQKAEWIVKAWRDEDVFHSLSAAEQAELPRNPAGELIEKLLLEQSPLAQMSLLNDDCSMTMIGPHGC